MRRDDAASIDAGTVARDMFAIERKSKHTTDSVHRLFFTGQSGQEGAARSSSDVGSELRRFGMTSYCRLTSAG